MHNETTQTEQIKGRGLFRCRVLEGYCAVMLVLVISLTTWMFAYSQVTSEVRAGRIEWVHKQAADIRDDVNERFRDYKVGLNFGHQFVMASKDISREEWEMFYSEKSMDEYFPGVLGYGYVEHVEADELDGFVETMRANGAPEYAVKNLSDHDALVEGDPKYLIKYHEPASKNREAWGLDVASTKKNRTVYDISRDTGERSVSDPIRLFQSGGDEWGLVFAEPIYRDGLPTDTIEQRREAIEGWVVSTIGLDRFFAAEWSDDWDGFGIELYVNEEVGTKLIYSTPLAQDAEGVKPSTFIPLDMGRISLLLRVVPVEGAGSLYASGNQLLVLVSGFLITALLTSIAWSITQTRAKAVALASSMTKTIRESELCQRALAEEANAANRVKSEFMANMSHEIRTPMTAILGYGEVLEENVTDETNPSCKEAIAAIQRSGNHLMLVINDVLDISKIESGKLAMEPSECMVLETVRDVYQSFQIGASQKGLALRVEFETPVPELVITDAHRVKQILINLVGNAIKFTSHGSVTLALRCDDDQIEFSVWDTGHGIAMHELASLFRPFEQLDNSMTRKHEGTGLGLAISKRLANALGGDIVVESELGMGSVFTLSIPRGTSGAQRMVEALPSLSKEIGSGDGSGTKTKKSVQIRAKVLLVEDGEDNQRLILHVLSRAGIEVETAENGQVAVDRLAGGHDFDLVLMDMQMPVMDGYTATRKLRQLGVTTPIVALTAHAMAGDRKECLDAGCDEYAAKPIDREQLYEIIRRLIGGSSDQQSAA